MKPDTMRAVDYWVGVPLCFLFSLVNSVLRLFRRSGKPKNVLFIELSEMGSTILAYSAMSKAKERYKSVYFLIFKENEQSIKMLDIMPERHVLTIRSKNLFLLAWDTFKILFTVRKLKIDTVVDLELFSRFTSLLSFFSGARTISGFYKYHMEGLYRGNFQTHKVQYNPYYHISQSFQALVEALEANPKEYPLLKQDIPFDSIKRGKIESTSEQKKKMFKKLQKEHSEITPESKLVILNPNASDLLPIRRWPIEKFQKLAQQLLTLKNVYLIIPGIVSEKKDAQAICSYVKNERCIDFTGKTSLRELVDLFNIAHVLISNDSGPAHFASLTDIHIITLFGPETPKLYGPLSPYCQNVTSNYACSPCVSAFNHRKTVCSNNRCLQAIDVNQVLLLAKKHL